MSSFVKGCQMSALSRRPVSGHEGSTGRRLTGLEGGNRGMMRRGCGRRQRYGDLTLEFLAQVGEVVRYGDIDAC
jgi:hypothetical protein